MVNKCQVCGNYIVKGTNPVVISFKSIRFYSHLPCITDKWIFFDLETFKRLNDNGNI
jgi:hypothetical protein